MIPFDTSRRRLLTGMISAMGASVLGTQRAAACRNPMQQFGAKWPELVSELPLDQPRAVTHPLRGRVWSAAHPWSENAVDSCGFDANFRLMQNAIASADIACLGEVHDNPAHHMFRAKLLTGPAGEAKPAGAVFEQISDDQRAGLDAFAQLGTPPARRGTADDLLKLIDWAHSSWAKTADYSPLFEAVIGTKLPIYPGDVARDIIKRAAKDGLAAVLGAEEMTRLALEKPLGEAADTASQSEIEESHCGVLPKEAVPRLATAQRLRDAHLADAVLRAVKDTGAAFLLAGNGHVRTDRGVPWYLRQRAPEKKLVSVVLVEVEDGKTDPESYIPRAPDGTPAADFAVFTPRPKRPDPCDSMKAPQYK